MDINESIFVFLIILGCVVRVGLMISSRLKNGEEPELSGRKALQATELIFATYESSRCRKKITLPLDIEDSPLLSMIKNGDVAEPD